MAVLSNEEVEQVRRFAQRWDRNIDVQRLVLDLLDTIEALAARVER